MEHVVLVDEFDNIIGTMEKLEAHEKGLLHRAFSILLFNSKGEILLQKRSSAKYHSGGLWTNTCCSHPLPNERMEDATQRKLKQEMGIEASMEFNFKFIYNARLDKNLIEHEYDHVYTGMFDGVPILNREEVEDWKFIDFKSLQNDMELNPELYTYWFKAIVNHPELNLITA